MAGLSISTRWLRPSTVSSIRSSFLCTQTANLHQQGPSRSAVVHEQALPQNQQAPIPPVEQSTTPNSHKLDTLISQIPLVQSLRQSHTYKESRPHLAIPPAIRQHHFVGGSLAGPGKLALAPYMWTSSRNEEAKESDANTEGSSAKTSSVVSVFHIGRDLCGHPGFVHGGLLSVLFDEVFARCISAAFPSGLGMTANLNVDFRKPALPDRLYVLRTETTKVEGRKAWVHGKMIYLPLALPLTQSQSAGVYDIMPDESLLSEDSEGAVMVAEAKALFIEPKFADSMVSVYRT
ncbi:Thioesterase superfamily [Penicillium herquei]|nr:Thioesterase superfamily [Penicillium herquei]